MMTTEQKIAAYIKKEEARKARDEQKRR